MAGWSKRFFVLYSDWKLKYYQNEFTESGGEASAGLKGEVDLSHIEAIYSLDGKYEGSGYAFHLISNRRIWELFVKTQTEMTSWMKYIAYLRMGKIRTPKEIGPIANMSAETRYTFESFPKTRVSATKFPTTTDELTTFPGNQTQQPTKQTTTQPTQLEAQPTPQPTPSKATCQLVCDNPRKLESSGFSQQAMQSMTLLRWLNLQLGRLGRASEDSLRCLGDGETIVGIVQLLTGTTPEGVNVPVNSMRDKMQNTTQSFQCLADKASIEPPMVSSSQLITGNSHALDEGCWELVYMSQIKTLAFEGLTDRFALMAWLTQTLRFYPSIQPKNFNTSFQDGLAFCALVHAHQPSAINFNSLETTQEFKIAQNLRTAFDLLEDIWKVPKLLEAHDVISNPDDISIIIYLSYCFKQMR